MKCSFRTEVINRTTHHWEYEEPGKFKASLSLEEGTERWSVYLNQIDERGVCYQAPMHLRLQDLKPLIAFLTTITNERT